MKRISDIVAQLKIIKPETEPKNERNFGEEWELIKSQVMKLNPNVSEVISQYGSMNPEFLRISKSTHTLSGKRCPSAKHYQLQIASIQGRSVELIAYECETCGLFAAWYVVFDHLLNQCFKWVLEGNE